MTNKITFYHISRYLLSAVARILFKVRIIGIENVPEPPYIVTANHASYLDPPLIGMACRKDHINFMAKKELFQHPIMSLWGRLVRCIEVSRGENSIKSIREALNRIKSGSSVGLFPEGTRSEDGSLQEAKRGVGFLVAKSKVPVLPVYIHGTDKALPKKGKINYGQNITVVVGKPIMPEDVFGENGDKKDYEQVANNVMDYIENLKISFKDLIS